MGDWRKLTFCLRLWHRVHAVLFLFLGFKPVPAELEEDDMNENSRDEESLFLLRGVESLRVDEV